MVHQSLYRLEIGRLRLVETYRLSWLRLQAFTKDNLHIGFILLGTFYQDCRWRANEVDGEGDRADRDPSKGVGCR